MINGHTITLLRHACVLDEHATTKDVGLSDIGIQQTKSLDGHYQLVLCSKLKRAVQTLQYSNITYDKIIYTQLLREHMLDKMDLFETEDESFLETPETDQELLFRIGRLKKLLRDLLNGLKTPINVLLVGHSDFFYNATLRKVDVGRGQIEEFGRWLCYAEQLKLVSEVDSPEGVYDLNTFLEN
uniref:Phosphoglycerate mutase family protein n=1 Tax=viral metagenome TaxID=1070528 RepID=A0A6C0CMH0_9ZZZZ